MIIWTWNSTGDDFLVCGLTSNLGLLADEFKKSFPCQKRLKIVSVKSEPQKETDLLKRQISVDDFGWHVE